MKVSDIMGKGVAVADINSTMQKAAETMRDKNIGAVVVKEGKQLVGMVTDRDMVVRAVSEGRNSAAVPLGDIMTDQLFACFYDQDVEEAVALMKEKRVRRVLVIDHDSVPVGFLSLGDVAAHENIHLVAEVLKGVAEPAHSS